jgi:hypothetical protein
MFRQLWVGVGEGLRMAGDPEGDGAGADVVGGG